MKLVNIGFGNMVSASKVVAVVSNESDRKSTRLNSSHSN